MVHMVWLVNMVHICSTAGINGTYIIMVRMHGTVGMHGTHGTLCSFTII